MPNDRSAMTRRRFLAGSLAAGTGWLLAGRLPAAEPAGDANRWALLSDTHVWEHRDRKHRGVNPVEGFLQVREEILALRPRPAGIVFAGDCVFLEGRAADYAVLADLVEPLRKAGIGLHFALGNHDHRENFWSAFPEARRAGKPEVPNKHATIVSAAEANWFLLDSLEKTQETPGRLGKAQLQWLAKALDARREKPALVVAHHPRDAAGAIEGLKDTDALFDVLLPRNQVKAYFFGHTHRWEVSEHRGIHLVNLPATAWVFNPKEPRGWVDAHLGPGGIALTLHALDKKHKADGQTVELAWRG